MSDIIALTEKYRPNTFDEIMGNYDAISQVKFHINDIHKGILLHGKPGVGKTTLAYVVANELNLEVLEINSSEQRTGKIIKKIIGVSSNNCSLDNNKKLIIIDEVDNLHGNSDKGGAKEIIDIIKESIQPIILTCNNLYDISIQLRNICTIIELKPIKKMDIFIALSKICKKEDLNVHCDVLNKIAENSEGDLRQAINDLESNVLNNTEISLDNLVLSKKQNKDNIFETMNTLISSPNISITNNNLMNSEKNPEDLVQWFEQNLGLLFRDKNDLHKAYENLSKADVFLGRVRNKQKYKMWKYTTIMLSCINNVHNESNNSKQGYIKFQSPQHWSILKNNSRIRNVRKELFIKLSKNYSISSRHIPNVMLDFFIFLIQNNSLNFCIENNLTKDEISYLLFQKLTTDKETTKIINELYELSQEQIKLNDANSINILLDSILDKNILNDDNKKVKLTKEEQKIQKLDKKQFSFDDY